MERRENIPSREEAILFLRKVGCSKEVVKHCILVSEVASEIAQACKRRGKDVNVKLVEVGAILHDVGRSITHGVKHGVIGGDIVRKAGFPEAIARIVENHIGAGIPAEEAAALGLEARDYVPKTLEEKIVTYADKLVEGSKRVGVSDAIEYFSRNLGPKHPALKRFKRLHEEISNLAGSEFNETFNL
jgi:uncharacterized protein